MTVVHAQFKREHSIQYIKKCDKCNTGCTNALIVDVCQCCGSTTTVIGLTWETGEERQ